MTPALFMLAVLLGGGPSLAAWLITRRGHAQGWGVLVAALATIAGFWLLRSAVDAHLETYRAAWLVTAPHDWAGLDQPGRKAVVDAISTRLAHGRLVAQLPVIALGLNLAGLGLLAVRAAYAAFQRRRQPRLD